MPGKMRVHELAKELGADSRELLRELSHQGEFVKSASAPLEPSVVHRMRTAFGKPAPTLPEQPEPSPEKLAQAQAVLAAFMERPSKLEDTTTAAVEADVRPSRQPPFRAADDAVRRALTGRGLPPRLRPHRSLPPPSASRFSGSPFEVLALEIANGDRYRAPGVGEHLQDWLARRFSLEDVRVWYSAGLEVQEAALAQRCRDAGLLPEYLSCPLDGLAIIHRLRCGERPDKLLGRIWASG